jgi:hypothetical protein
VVAFIASLLITGIMTGIVLRVAQTREPGRPMTWGEAFIAATFVFTLLFMAYGVVPHHWLAWADNELNWRKDSLGIPTGPLPFKNHTLFEDGITFFGRGRVLVSKETIRDFIVMGIYGAFLVAHIIGWLAWQRRGQKPEVAIETSAYGRPLLRKS